MLTTKPDSRGQRKAPAGPPDPGLEARIGFLRDPRSYAEPTARVETVETHMSWVFLTDRFVYKLKKPVIFESIDFRLLSRRRRNAFAELRLNRRLAETVYLGAVAITISADGTLRFGGSGCLVDWLVKMRRLPAERMLDRLILSGELRENEIQALAGVLSAFFLTARPADISPRRYISRFHQEIENSARELRRLGSVRLALLAEHCVGLAQARLEAASTALQERARAKRIVEGHGDLRPEHVCLEQPPVVIDCLEFSQDLRLLDPVDELAYLGMESRRLGAPTIARILLHEFAKASGEHATEQLVQCYTTIRALIRARIAILHLKERTVRDPEKWPLLAEDYLKVGTWDEQ